MSVITTLDDLLLFERQESIQLDEFGPHSVSAFVHLRDGLTLGYVVGEILAESVIDDIPLQGVLAVPVGHDLRHAGVLLGEGLIPHRLTQVAEVHERAGHLRQCVGYGIALLFERFHQ